MDSKAFGKFIAECRKEKHMTQAELAQIINVTDKAVSRWERGIGFPDINTLEPLASALDISILELMHSQKSDERDTKEDLYENEMTEIMQSAVEMAKENQRQDKTAVWIGAAVTVIVAAFIKLSSSSNIGGAFMAGAVISLGPVGMYLLIQNREDKESRRIYGFFMLAGVGFLIALFRFIGVDTFSLTWGVYGIFCFMMGVMNL